jgi:hypothetical protein
MKTGDFAELTLKDKNCLNLMMSVALMNKNFQAAEVLLSPYTKKLLQIIGKGNVWQKIDGQRVSESKAEDERSYQTGLKYAAFQLRRN